MIEISKDDFFVYSPECENPIWFNDLLEREPVLNEKFKEYLCDGSIKRGDYIIKSLQYGNVVNVRRKEEFKEQYVIKEDKQKYKPLLSSIKIEHNERLTRVYINDIEVMDVQKIKFERDIKGDNLAHLTIEIVA
ncbi:hypothetical protein [Anaerosinus massiliensis]|uniref:hypothetical protein n=1 Tax=Massilibacillus massiliensis TaxID=1806837 RepID=UPI000DA619F9|nr:hypothetical protein [Massilibacillus massiliensis]